MLAVTNSNTLEIQYLPLSSLTPLAGNSKKHATENTIKSILKYGFRDPIAIDMTLNGGKGAIVEGHDRRSALMELKRNNSLPPRGIHLNNDGDWLVPVVVGLNANSEAEAVAYSIDHNLSNIKAAGLNFVDELKLFDTDLLQEQVELVGDLVNIDIDNVFDTVRAMDVDYDFDCGDNDDGDYEDDDIPEDNKEIKPEYLKERKHKCPECGFEW